MRKHLQKMLKIYSVLRNFLPRLYTKINHPYVEVISLLIIIK